MKKKCLTLFTLVIFCVSFLTGCNLFTVDTEKDFAQVIATVGEEKEYVDEITKLDLLTVFVNQGSSYLQQGYSADKVMDYFYQSLVNRRILIQEAVKAIIEDKQPSDGTVKLTLKEVLDPTDKDVKISNRMKILLADNDVKNGAESDENVVNRLYNEAYNAVIESENSQIKTIVDRLKTEADEDYVASDTTEATKRPTRPETDEKAPVKLKELPDRLNKAASEDTKDETAEKEFRRKAYKEYVRSIEKSKLYKEDLTAAEYIDEYFETMLVEQLEQKLVTLHSDMLKQDTMEELSKGESDKIENSEIFKILETRYDRLQESQKQQFDANLAANITKIEGLSDTTYVLYNATEGKYGYVKHILFKFDETATLDVAKLNSMDWNKQKKLNEREKLVYDIVVKDLREENEDVDLEVPIDTTNVTKKVNDFMEMFNLGFTGTKTPIAVGETSAAIGSKPIYKVSKAPATTFLTYESTAAWRDTNAENLLTEVRDAFTDWEYAYSGDTGTLGSSTDMLLNSQADPFLSNQKYVKEFSEAARNVINAGIGTYTTVTTDFGVHLIYCTDTIEKVGDGMVKFNEDRAVRIIKADVEETEISDTDKASAEYKIFQVLKSEKVDKNYNETMEAVAKKYKEDGKVSKKDKLYDEIVKYVKG